MSTETETTNEALGEWIAEHLMEQPSDGAGEQWRHYIESGDGTLDILHAMCERGWEVQVRRQHATDWDVVFARGDAETSGQGWDGDLRRAVAIAAKRALQGKGPGPEGVG